jgi:predicted Zn finger-like uncharacterized protein
MQTRCPNCQTLYRIDEDVLKRAGGQARCFRCDAVFDAYQPTDDAAGKSDTGPAADNDTADTPLAASEPAQTSAAQEAIEPGPDNDAPFDAPQPLDISEVPDLAVSAEAVAEADNTLPFEVPQDLPDIEPAPEHTLDAQRTLAGSTGHGIGYTLLPGLLGVLLIALALGQLAWFNRGQVLATPLGHKAATGLCMVAGCEVPARRAPSQFAVLDRNIGPDPERDGVLMMQLGFSNNADFAQPLPDIQLSLYDSQQKLMARRRLHPDEYLFPAPLPDALVAPGDTVQVDVRLEDPGRHATGFKLEFL